MPSKTMAKFTGAVGYIRFTLLYFKMALMPLALKTKMADVGQLISLGNLLVRKVTWLVLITTSTTLILSHDFGADCITRIDYIYSRLSGNHSFPFRLAEATLPLKPRLTETTHSFHFDFRRQHTLYLLHLTSSSQPHKCILSATIFFLVLPLWLDLLQPRKQPQKFRQTTERNNQHGRRHVPPNIHH